MKKESKNLVIGIILGVLLGVLIFWIINGFAISKDSSSDKFSSYDNYREQVRQAYNCVNDVVPLYDTTLSICKDYLSQEEINSKIQELRIKIDECHNKISSS